MAKLADYCIFTVHYNDKHTHIVTVKAMPGKDQGFGAEVEFKREEVVSKLGQGTTFVTVYMRGGTYQKGEDVRIVTINGTKYIRTDQNQKESDNLGALPEY